MTVLPTEADGEWTGDLLEDVLPKELDSHEWVQLEPREVSGSLVNQFKHTRSNLVVMASVSPIVQKGSEDRKVSYHLIIANMINGKTKKPTVSDINRAKDTFICRSLEPEEVTYEGQTEGSKAHHVICVFVEKSRIIAP